MFAWLSGPGRVFREPLPDSTNYLGAYDRTGALLRMRNQQVEEEQEDAEQQDQENEDDANTQQATRKLPKERASDLRPFPLNQDFRSQSVLSEELREEVWRQVVEEKSNVSTVSVQFGIDTRRVAAVVRLKSLEKQWIAQGKQLATPYAEAVLKMVPQTPYSSGKKITPHESINDLPVHPYTRQQIFYPTSESRQFTRADAAKVFSPNLLPADERIPHPELIQSERDTIAQIPREQRIAAIQARDEKIARERARKEREEKEWQEKNVKTVEGQRWTFKFENVNVEAAGEHGRGRNAVGWRYGNPHNDRKRGAVKIPTSVE